jgi:hypothetical protein
MFARGMVGGARVRVYIPVIVNACRYCSMCVFLPTIIIPLEGVADVLNSLPLDDVTHQHKFPC